MSQIGKMMNFKRWLAEFDDKDFNHYRNMVFGILNLDLKNGLNQSLSAWEPDKLIDLLNGLGEFKNLSVDTQNQVIGQIRSGAGTIEKLVRMMSNPVRTPKKKIKKNNTNTEI